MNETIGMHLRLFSDAHATEEMLEILGIDEEELPDGMERVERGEPYSQRARRTRDRSLVSFTSELPREALFEDHLEAILARAEALPLSHEPVRAWHKDVFVGFSCPEMAGLVISNRACERLARLGLSLSLSLYPGA